MGAGWLAVLVASVAAAPCGDAVSARVVDDLLEEAEASLGALDLDGFRSATVQVEAVLPCVSEPVTRALAARIHRVRGLQHYAASEPEQRDEAFAAARSLEPAYSFPSTVVAESNPIRTSYEAAAASDEQVAQAPPAQGELAFDGRRGIDRPAARASVYQRFDADGAVVDTAYLYSADPTPSYELLQAPDRPARPWALVAATAGASVATGVLVGLGYSAEAAWNAASSETEADPHRTRANSLALASGGAGVLALGGTVLTVRAW